MKSAITLIALGAVLTGLIATGMDSGSSQASQPKNVTTAPVEQSMFQTGIFGRQIRTKVRRGETRLLRVIAPTIARQNPGSGRIVRRIPTTTPYGLEQMQLRVLREVKGEVDPATGTPRMYYLVHIPFRRTSLDSSNGHVGWVASDRVQVISTAFAVHINLTNRRVTLRKFGRNVGSWPADIGRASTPTPRGQFAIYGRSRRQNQPTAGDGVLAFAYSPVLAQFDGRNGMVALHGLRRGGGSYGCVRVNDSVIRNLVRQLPIGTPVVVKR